MTTFELERLSVDTRFRSAVLVDRVWETDSYVRVTLRGDDLRGFDSPGADDHFRLFFPEGHPQTVEQFRQSPSREYTPRSWRDDLLDVEFVIHGEPGHRGVAAAWAADAPIGAAVGVGGPRRTMRIGGMPEAWFLAGDETAVPAMRRFAASMPSDATGSILIEVEDSAHELAIAAPSGVTVGFVHRSETTLAARLDALSEVDRPHGDVFVFIAAEQAIVKPGRALAVDRWGIDPERMVAKGYWRRDEHEPAAPAPHV